MIDAKSFEELKEAFELGKITPTNWLGDSVQRMDTYSKYSSMCESVTEFGVYTGSSTVAFLLGNPKKMTSYDISSEYFSILPVIEKVSKLKNIDYKFIKESSLKVDIEPTDLLFIDTVHKKKHVTAELNKHHKSVKKYILLHDTTAFPEVFEAAEEFISKNKNWYIDFKCNNRNGLTVLKNINASEL
jgi:hypothetical protein